MQKYYFFSNLATPCVIIYITLCLWSYLPSSLFLLPSSFFPLPTSNLLHKKKSHTMVTLLKQVPVPWFTSLNIRSWFHSIEAFSYPSVIMVTSTLSSSSRYCRRLVMLLPIVRRRDWYLFHSNIMRCWEWHLFHSIKKRI